MTASISPCGKYRYHLARRMPRDHGVSIATPPLEVTFIMLNPSTADATNNDPTLRRCIELTTRLGFHVLNVVNLYAFRSPHPKDLALEADPRGSENEEHLRRYLAFGTVKIAAWGANAFAREEAERISKRYGPFLCFGTTKDGSPKHPLARGKHRISADQKLMEWKGYT